MLVNIPCQNRSLAEQIAVMRAGVGKFARCELGAGISEICGMPIGRELCDETL